MQKSTLFVIGIVLLLCSTVFAKSKCIDIKYYVKEHKVLAKVLSCVYGIPSQIILGVAIEESSAGNSEAAKVLNNHFGIVGENYFITRKGSKSKYKQYTNEVLSYLDFCMILSNRKYYKKIKYKNNCKLWLETIASHGYSEAPEEWQAKILRIIKKYKLK